VRKLTKALTVVSLLAPVSGHSLGIGDIRVRSALNQNLNAEIGLVDTRGVDPSSIKVSLAPAEKFDEAGVPWSYFLSKIRFTPIVKPNGSMVIKVASREALKEPYLNFLLEVTWPKGNLYREFTVLVDPPADYQQQAYKEPQYQEPTYSTSSSYDTYRPPKQDYVPRQRAVRHRVVKPRRNAGTGNYGSQVVARRNDTLWSLAERARDSGVTVEQMMVALYEKNPQAFYQQNVNALSAGKTLQVPEKGVVQQTTHQEALAEFGRQNDAWNSNRSGVPARVAQAAKETGVDNQLKLEAPVEATVGANETVSPSSEQTPGNADSSTSKSLASNPEAKAQQQAETNKGSSPADDAIQGKIAALEKQMAMMQELIALKDKQLAELQKPAQESKPEQIAQPQTPPVSPEAVPTQPEKPVATAQPVQTAPTPATQAQPPAVTAPEKPVQPVAPPKPVVKPEVKPIAPPAPAAEDSSTPIAWVLGGLGAILLPLFGWLWWQKKKITQETEAESTFRNYSTMRTGESTGAFSSARRSGASSGLASGDSSFLNDFKASDFESFESFNVDHGDIDPLAEADVYLAYGRYQQAEDLIKQAIKDHPERDDCKLKLLEIFHASSNKEDFEKYAAELAAAGKKDEKDFWKKVSEMGVDINPDSELFKSSGIHNVAVFSSEAETLAENVLLSPSAEHIPSAKIDDENTPSGAATFEVPEADEGESLYDASVPEPTAQKSHETSVINKNEEDDNSIDKLEADLKLAEEKFEGQDNESIDFDLDLYPNSNDSDKPEITSDDSLDLNDFESDLLKTKPDDLTEINEFEAFEFDFDLDKAESDKPEKAETVKAEDSWDPDQTLDFSFDDKIPETDDTGNDILDFSFDLDSPLETSFGKTSGSDGFRVSDLTDMDEMETKLDLAKAYIDMGDTAAAKDIIGQVIEKGAANQKETAQKLLDELG
jgi:pilus assembly protein FimV